MYVHLTRSNPKGLGAYGFEDTPTAFTLKQEPLLVLLGNWKKTLPPPRSYLLIHTRNTYAIPLVLQLQLLLTTCYPVY